MNTHRVFASVAFLLSGIHCVISLDQTVCRDAAIPAVMVRGFNYIDSDSTKPLFELKVVPQPNSGKPKAYNVHIVTHSQAYAFTDATIAISANDKCGKGDLQYNSSDFFQVQQDQSCPKVLFTNRKTPMSNLPPLLWTPPSCGCVQLRAVLTLPTGKYYFAETDDLTTGPLTKRICVQEGRIEMTREQRLDALCHVANKRTSGDIMSSDAFKKRHQLDIQYTDPLELEMALELRKADARACCAKQSQKEKLRCFETVRYRRADRFCKDGFLDLPFVTFRSSFMRSKERRCCSIIGRYRYLCFAKDSNLEPGSDVTPMDYSLDAIDPVNDLAELCTVTDFNEYLEKVLKVSKPKKEIWPVTEIRSNGASSKGQKFENKTQVDGNDHRKNNTHEHAATVAKISTPIDKPSAVKQSESFRNVKSTSSVSRSQAVVPVPVSSTTTEKTRTRTSVHEPQKSQSKRYSSEVNRRQPSRAKPHRFVKTTSSERRKYRRKFGGRSRLSEASRRGSAEKTALRRASFERNLQRGKLGSSRDPLRGSKRFSKTNDKRLYTRTSAGTREPVDRTTRFMEDFDDEGGKSVEETLTYIEHKMKRLELRRLCCQAGALLGGEVYGSLSVVMGECSHSSFKYLEREHISFGMKKCRNQFVKCCVEEAKMGLTMTSTEFRNKDFDNFHRIAPVTARKDKMLLRRSFPKEASNYQPEQSEKVKKSFSSREDLDAESDRRFDSMRAKVGDPRFESGDNLDEDEEYTGPRRFDDEDNRSTFVNSDDDVNIKTAVGKERKTFAAERKSPGTKSRNVDAIEKDETPDEVEEQEEEEEEEKEEDNEKQEKKYKKKEDINEQKIEETKEKNNSKLLDQIEKDIFSGKLPTTGELPGPVAKAASQQSFERANQRQRSSYRRSRERASGGLSRKSRRNRSRASRRRQGGSSRRRSRYNYNQSRRRFQRHGKRNRPIKRHRTEVAMDSKEMAAANEKHDFLPALDSKEMAAKYEQVNDGVTTTRRRQTNGFRISGGLSRRRKRNGQRAYDW